MNLQGLLKMYEMIASWRLPGEAGWQAAQQFPRSSEIRKFDFGGERLAYLGQYFMNFGQLWPSSPPAAPNGSR